MIKPTLFLAAAAIALVASPAASRPMTAIDLQSMHRLGSPDVSPDDPLTHIACLQEKKNIKVVMKEGRIYADRRPGKSKNVVNVKPGDWKIIDYL
ncbi:MAG TPA: hypothetical protein VK192_06325 [Sphingomicrobium sp.]|nr:hypothetical protein [Sphingomicrobium sp.]